MYACNQQSVLKEDFNCKEIFFNNLEVIKDIKGTFSVEFPTSWKTSVYTDEVQSSIYAADTTKQLTEAILLDVNYIYNSITISDIFKLKIEHENLSNKLIQKTAKEFSFLDKPSYYVVSIGKKGKYKYKSLQIFVHINKEKSLVVKAEIYGDSLVNQRLCKAITLIEKIKLEQ
ncbi:hypothetical protein CW731_02475 [Polaribacter sp. ALD11]|nr:hypothetical protein CW731_02475 [Polaribacter sp. ALD11]